VTAAALKKFKQFDGRRHRRAVLTLRGRYMLSDGREYDCRTIDISAGGIAILGAIKGKVGERVVVYLDQVGRVEGTIVRHFGGCFAIELSTSSLKRDWLNLQIERLVKQQAERRAQLARLWRDAHLSSSA
jgi:hypothetical protein